jgi:hypothetical protein
VVCGIVAAGMNESDFANAVGMGSGNMTGAVIL